MGDVSHPIAACQGGTRQWDIFWGRGHFCGLVHGFEPVAPYLAKSTLPTRLGPPLSKAW